MIAEDQIFSRLGKTIERTLKTGAITAPITRATTAQNVQGWDSLTHAILMMAVEREFGVELPIEDTLEMDNVGDLVDVICRLSIERS